MILTRDELAGLAADPDTWLPLLNDAFNRYEIDTEARMSYFLAQVAHESQGFTRLVENLNYSPQGLLATFPSRFQASEAVTYAHDPVRIANRVYASRMGNGDEGSGDGFAYRGRGLIQITGRLQYDKAGQAIGVDLIADPDKAADPVWAALTACWFWRSSGCNELADQGLFMACTRRINGGLQGEADREVWLAKTQAAFQSDTA